MSRYHDRGICAPPRGGFRPQLYRRNSGEDKYQTETSLHPRHSKIRKPLPCLTPIPPKYFYAKRRGLHLAADKMLRERRLKDGRKYRMGVATAIVTAAMLAAMGSTLAADNASAQDAPQTDLPVKSNPCDGALDYKVGDEYHWYLGGGADYGWPGDPRYALPGLKVGDFRLQPNACVDSEKTPPVANLFYLFKKERVPNIKALDKQVDCGPDFPDHNKKESYSCGTGINPPIDFDGKVVKVEDGYEYDNLGDGVYVTPVRNVTVEAEGVVGGVVEQPPQNSPFQNPALALAVLIAGGGAVGYAVARRLRRSKIQNVAPKREVVGRTKEGKMVYGKPVGEQNPLKDYL